MNRRVWILLLFAAGTLLDRGFAVYEYFLAPTRSRVPPFSYKIEGKYLTVESIQEKELFQAGLREEDRVIEAYNIHGEGKRISGLFDLGTVMRTIRRDESWILVVKRAGMEMGLTVPPQPASNIVTANSFLLIWISLLLPVVMVFAGFFMGFSRPQDDHAFLACLLFLGFSAVISSTGAIPLYPPGVRELSLFFHLAQSCFASYLFLRFFLLFPSPSHLERRAPWLKNAMLVVSIVGFTQTLALEFTKSVSFENYWHLRDSVSIPVRVSSGFDLMMVLAGLASLFMNTFKAPALDEKRRITILLAGITSGVLIPASVVAFWESKGTDLSWWLIATVIVLSAGFPHSFVYVVLKHRVSEIRMLLRRGLQYLLVSRGFYIMEAVLIFTALYLTIGTTTFHLQVSADPGFGWRLAVLAALAFGLAMALPTMNRRVMPYIDRKFFRETYNAQKILGDLTRAIQRQPEEPEQLIDLAITQVSHALFVDRVAVFLRGARVVDTAQDPEQVRESSIVWVHRKAGDFQCCGIRARSESEIHGIVFPKTLEHLLLPAGGLVARKLRETIAGPRAVEIYWDHPDSWIRELTLIDSPSDQRNRERSVLERLNTRLIVPMVTNEQLLGFLSLGEKLSEEPYSREDKELLLAVANQMAIALHYILLIDQVTEQEKLRSEIEIAKQMQAQLFPQRIPAMKTLDYTGICKAAREVGGDYYDFLEIGPGRLGLAVADISGKGISAALLMASLQALLRSHAHLHGDRAELLVWDINRLMYSSTTEGKYASLFYGFYDDLSRLLVYVNAGHLPPILRRKDGSIQRLKTGGMVVGMMPDTSYRQETVQLQPGDILLLFSDGITEAMNTKEQEFGEERLLPLISSLTDLPAASLSDAILDRIADYVGTAPQHDDSTLVVIKVL